MGKKEILESTLNNENINYWLRLSIEYANQRSYLDDLFRVYPTIPEGIREINEELWKEVEIFFMNNDKINLILTLLKFEKFPIKDSYIAYLKRDPSAIHRNPKTVDRIASRLFDLGLNEIYRLCSEPKETNRQIGPMFRNWLRKTDLGIDKMPLSRFVKTNKNAILIANDNEMLQFAKSRLGYKREKGLDFIARIDGKYIIGEAKFLTDFGGHQNAQFEDAIQTLNAEVNENTIKIAILDGVLYIPGKSKMFKKITTELKDYNIMSALILREFLFAV